MYTLTHYLYTLEHPIGLCRRLKGFQLLRQADGRPIFFVGNSAIIFKIQLLGQTLRLRCPKRPLSPSQQVLYGDSLWREELFLYTREQQGEWVDVVVERWIEGRTLDEVIDEALATANRPLLEELSRRFLLQAASWLPAEWAHGDLKPENILVGRQGELRLIDFEGCYHPNTTQRIASELGTPTYQHPARTAEDFDRWLDHFPATLIAVQLEALAIDPSLPQRYPHPDTRLFSAEELFSEECLPYRAVIDLFARQGRALHYRLAHRLRQPSHRLLDVEEIFTFGALLERRLLPDHPHWECYIERGLSGFRSPLGVTTPPLYDEAFDFHEGWAAVRLANHWFYIDEQLRVVYTLPPCEAVKSRRNGAVRYRVDDVWIEKPIPSNR